MQKLYFVFLSILVVSACQNEPKATPATVDNTPKEIQVPALPEVSLDEAADWQISGGTVSWRGSKPTGASHSGTVKISGGTLKIGKEQLLKGTITLDMTSIQNLDLQEADGKSKLEGHLKSPDFFDVANFPIATFEIEEVLPSAMPDFNRTVRGSLKMKGKENTVNIPVQWSVSGNTATAKSATFFIDRTQWGVNFNSGILGTIKDKLIDDKVLLSFELEAKQ